MTGQRRVCGRYAFVKERKREGLACSGLLDVSQCAVLGGVVLRQVGRWLRFLLELLEREGSFLIQ